MSWPPAVGKPLPRAREAHGVDEKLRAYSLNPWHDVGSHKARVFRSALGITLDDVGHLAEQLLGGILTAPVTAARDNAPHGFLCEVPISVRGVNRRAGSVARTTSVWECRSPEDAPRLVSAYIES